MGDGTKLNREAYEKLIAEDLAWLRCQRRTLEQQHIEVILKSAVAYEFDITKRIAAAVADLKAENACLRILASTSEDGDFMPFSWREAVAARDEVKCRMFAKRSHDFIKSLQERK